MVTFGYPVLWLLGGGGFYWPILGTAGAVYLLRRGLDRGGYLPFAIPLALLASAPIGVIAFGLDFGRIASLVGNLFVWIAVAALVSLGQRVDIAGLVAKTIVIVGIAQGFVSLAALAVYPSSLPVPVLHALASKLPSGLAAFASTDLVTIDWLGGSYFRSIGIMAQPTWAGVFGAITCLVALSLLTHQGIWRWLAVAGLASGAVSLALSLSRSTQIALVVALAVGAIVMLRNRDRLTYYVAASVAVVAGGIFMVGWGDQLGSYAEEINGQRVGSLNARSAIYARTWTLVQQLPFPLLGYGIKPQETGLVASVATHSAVLGMLFRGGMIAVALFALLFMVAFRRAVLASNPLAAALVVLVGLWSILEDFDPGHLTPLAIVLAFALTGRGDRRGPTAARRSAGDRSASSGG